MTTQNLKKKARRLDGSGVGLAYARNYLEEHYPGRYDLKINDFETIFELEFTIEL